MGSIKEINIKNRTYYFFSDTINVKNFDSNLLKIDKKSYKNIDLFYCIGYITIKDLHSMNPLYLNIDEVDGCIEEKNGNKYLVFASTDENKEPLKKYTELWDGIKNLIK